MACYLLHIMEDPDRDAYRDADLKDVVGLMPRFFCAQCQPLRSLLASEVVRCLRRDAQCWKTAPCDREDTGAGDQATGASGGDFTF